MRPNGSPKRCYSLRASGRHCERERIDVAIGVADVDQHEEGLRCIGPAPSVEACTQVAAETFACLHCSLAIGVLVLALGRERPVELSTGAQRLIAEAIRQLDVNAVRRLRLEQGCEGGVRLRTQGTHPVAKAGAANAHKRWKLVLSKANLGNEWILDPRLRDRPGNGSLYPLREQGDELIALAQLRLAPVQPVVEANLVGDEFAGTRKGPSERFGVVRVNSRGLLELRR